MIGPEFILFVAALLVLVASLYCWRQSFRRKHKLAQSTLAALCAFTLVLGGYLLILSGYFFWYDHRPLPTNEQTTLFQGVIFTRDVRSQPDPMVIDVVSIDLNAPNIGFLVTPGEPIDGYQLPSRTTSQFLREFNAQVAINGDCCKGWYSYTPWDFYPHPGEGINVEGFASSRGTVYSTGKPEIPTLYISAENKASFEKPTSSVYNAISGLFMIIENGKRSANLASLRHDLTDTQEPRTAYALDKDGTHLLLFTVDGRQAGYSEGASIAELIEIVLQYGGYTAMNVDGGGSTDLVVQGSDGWPVVLNSPIDNHIPGRERPVGNHLGVYANRINH